ncbi:MAG: pilus assembly protein PilM [Lachnospiraceae bacterium]|nr:pilus assembly protein PilM [Lachnospiraceae bacterium]
MANKFLTIYVSSDMIRIAEITKSGKDQVLLSNAAEIATPAGCFNDGYLTDVTATAEAVRTAIFGRGFSSKDVIFTIASKKIASKEVEMPYVKNMRKLQQVLQANSGDYFPMSGSGDYVFAYSLLEEVTMNADGANKRFYRISAVAAPMDLVRCYYELAEELKLSVKHIDYFGNSVIQLLRLQMQPGRTDLVLQIEMDQTYVNVMRGKTLVLQRNVNYGKTAVINALMDVKKISEKDARTLLSNEALLDQHVTADEYAQAVQGMVNGIGRAVEYHRTKNANDPSATLQGIKVFGEGSAIAGIEKILERELGARVEHFDTLAGVTIKGQAALKAEEVLRYLPNIGSVIDPMDLVITSGKKSAIETSDMLKYAKIALGVAAVVMLGWTGVTFIQHKVAKDARDQMQANIDAIADIEQIRQDYVDAQYLFVALDTFKYEKENPNNLLPQFIGDLEEILPTDTVINSIGAEDGVVSFELTTGWHTTAKNEVADVLVQLQQLEYVKKVEVPDLTESYCIRFLSPSANVADTANGEDPYLRMVSEDPFLLGEYVEVESQSDLKDLILEMAQGEGDDDYPEELTLESINDLWVELVQDRIKVTVTLGYDYNVEDRVSDEAGLTGDKAIVLNISESTDEPGENPEAPAPASDEEVIE